MTAAPAMPPNRTYPVLVLVGVLVGLCSGLFGLGGGVLVVPALTFLLGYDIKLASGTSLLAILIPSVSGVIAYGSQGDVNVLIAGLLALGSIVGAPVGSWVLSKVRPITVHWFYVLFLLAVIASMFLEAPVRGGAVEVTPVGAVALVGAGFVAGVCGGLLGIGGGMVVVPIMMMGFGVSDLMAKGTSLLMIIATSLSGTVANAKRKNVDVRAALLIGAVAAVAAPLGVALLRDMSPFVANMLFAAFSGVLLVRMLIGIWQERRAEQSAAEGDD